MMKWKCGEAACGCVRPGCSGMVTGTLVVLVLLCVQVSSGTVSAEVIVRHAGSANPLGEGWKVDHFDGVDPLSESDPQTVPVNDDGGVDAWRVDTNESAFVFQMNNDALDLDDFAGSMWKVSALLRVTEVDDRIDLGMFVDVYIYRTADDMPADHYYRMLFGSDPAGNPEVVLQGSTKGPYVISGTGYHLYEMIARPGPIVDGGALVSFYVDGVLLEEDYVGTHSLGRVADQVRFGGERLGTSGSTANFALVQLEVGDDLTSEIPEPATGILIVSGVAGIFTRRRRHPIRSAPGADS